MRRTQKEDEDEDEEDDDEVSVRGRDMERYDSFLLLFFVSSLS